MLSIGQVQMGMLNPNKGVQNIAVIGSTGSGKSTTANMLLNGVKDSPFTVGNDELSYTFLTDQHTNLFKKLRLIDTPGFGDNRFSEKEIDKIIKDFTLIITHPSVESTGVIDAFLLPVKFNPRPSTLKSDLEHVIDLFGSVALKTLIILPIFLDDKQRTETDIKNIFSNMFEVVNILKGGKNEELNTNWFCLWDNLKPKPYQELNLKNKIATLQPYTHKKFFEAQKAIKGNLDIQIQKQLEDKISKAKKEMVDQNAEMEARIKQAELAAAQEKQRIQEAVLKEQEERAKLAVQLQKKNEEHKAEMARLAASSKNKVDCTLETHGRLHFMQKGFHCKTCNLVGNAMVCEECAKTCHKGHLLVSRGVLRGFCDCRFDTLNCQLQNICTYKLSGKNPIKQQRFTCDTCKMDPGKGQMMCQHCAKVCHQSKGHKIRHLGLALGFCDCSLMYGFCCSNTKK
jgi:ABC-type dipeptide/oligopeptide/nickel transport system ATPase component